MYPARRRRRKFLVAGIAGAALLVVLVCAAFGALATGFGRLVRESDRAQDARTQVASACLDLERRLNRLAPPGAAGGPRQRAAAIRGENAALQPFLAEIEAVRGWRPDRAGPAGADDAGEEAGDDDAEEDGRPGAGRSWADRWRALADARAGYADALERQATGGAPAFFIAPRDAAGRPVLPRLEHGAESCAGVARRLAAPDL